MKITAKHLLVPAAALLCLLAFELSLGVCVQEDAFISFRYARNLVDGHGPVFNTGERVEGYTNFLWVLFIAAGMKVGIDPVGLARWLGAFFSLALAVAVYCTARRGSGDRISGEFRGLIALLLFSFAPYMGVEAVEGLETLFFSFCVFMGVALSLERRRGFPWATLFLVLAALTRPEGVLVAALVYSGSALFRLKHRLPLLGIADLAHPALFLVCYAPYWIWRFGYYGYPFPNSFYAKTGGGIGHVVSGLEYLGRYLLLNPAISFICLAALAALAIRLVGIRGKETDPGRRAGSPGESGEGPGSSSPGPAPWILGTVLTGYLLYIISVGGDFKKTFRFMIPLLPLLAVMIERILFSPRFSPLRLIGCHENPARFRISILLLAAAVVLNAAVSLPSCLAWAGDRREDLVKRTAAGQWLARNADPGAVLAIRCAGIIPYYSGLKTIDMWGINDVHIAHRKMPEMGWGLIGHEKNDHDYVFNRQPDIYLDEKYYITGKPVFVLKRQAFRKFGPHWFQRFGHRYEARIRRIPASESGTGKTLYFNYLELIR